MACEPEKNITSEELFRRVETILDLPEAEGAVANKMLHETLVLVCHEGLSDSSHAFGSDEFKTWEEILTYFERLGGQ